MAIYTLYVEGEPYENFYGQDEDEPKARAEQARGVLIERNSDLNRRNTRVRRSGE
jgi:hypothetical protein